MSTHKKMSHFCVQGIIRLKAEADTGEWTRRMTMKNVGVWMKHGVGMMCVVGLTGLGCLAGCTDNDAIVETMCLCKDVSPRAAEVKVVEVKRQECVPSWTSRYLDTSERGRTKTQVALAESNPPPRETDETGRKASGRKKEESAREAGCVDINTADVDALMTLPGIGKTRAQAIVEARKRRPFSSPRAITRVKGISEKSYKKMKEKVCPVP